MSRCVVAFCAGALAVHALPALAPPAACAGIAVLAVLLARRRRALAAACAGFALAHFAASQALDAGWPCDRDKEAVELFARIVEPPLEREGRTDFDAEVIRSSAAPPIPRRVRLAWYDADRLPATGETWHLPVKLRCRRGFANPGAQDRELALLRARMDATGYVSGNDPPERIAPAAGEPVERLRARIGGAIAAALPDGPSAAVLQGLAVGLRGNIPDALWEAFAVTGVAHLMAISGLHVTGCAVAVLLLLRLAWRLPACARLRGRAWIEAAVVVGATGGYALLSGSSVPALRTFATVAVVAGLRSLRRAVTPARALAATAGLLVAADPLAPASAGFWLSFVATAALLAVAAAGAGTWAKAVAFARAQGAITALLTPVLAASFGRLSLVAPLVNAVAIPLFSLLLLPALLATTALAAVAPAASAFAWRVLAALLDRTWPLLEWIAARPEASWSPAAVPLAASAAAVALGFAAFFLRAAGLRAAAAVLVLAVVAGRPAQLDDGAFTLTVVDVGQGLAAVVETAEHTLVFDAGARWRGGGAAARVSLLPLLRARGLRRIDRLVASHDDEDHAGGVETLRRGLQVTHLMAAPGSQLDADETCAAGESWRWDGVTFRVVHPPDAFAGSANERSCAIHVSGPGGSALLLADPEREAETALAARAIAADVVLLPHHGSKSSSSEPLVEAVGARLGIASAGFGNRWNMPVPAVVARWRAAGTTVLDTAAEGAITVRFPPRAGAFAVETERRGDPRWWRARPEP
jgi:competence protein ComEC